jgi:hypothetical protein
MSIVWRLSGMTSVPRLPTPERARKKGTKSGTYQLKTQAERRGITRNRAERHLLLRNATDRMIKNLAGESEESSEDIIDLSGCNSYLT